MDSEVADGVHGVIGFRECVSMAGSVCENGTAVSGMKKKVRNVMNQHSIIEVGPRTTN